jgi:hypothetical protein
MDLEALLLGIEPVAALGVGAAALALAPLIGALGNPEVGKSLAESGRDLTKSGIKWGLETFEKVQETVAEASESWNVLVAEAEAEIRTAKSSAKPEAPTEVEIAE